MRLFKHGLLRISAVLATVALATPATQNGFDAWYKAKYGRTTPMEDARIQEERANAAYRAAPPATPAQSAEQWAEQHFRAKYGRSTPREESRISDERASTAFRAAPMGEVRVDDQAARYRIKYGRSTK